MSGVPCTKSVFEVVRFYHQLTFMPETLSTALSASSGTALIASLRMYSIGTALGSSETDVSFNQTFGSYLARRESVNSTAHHNKNGWAGRFESSNFGYTERMPWYSVARPANAAFSDSEVDFGKAVGTCSPGLRAIGAALVWDPARWIRKAPSRQRRIGLKVLPE